MFTARPGMGKTYALRCFMKGLNPNQYQSAYYLPVHHQRVGVLQAVMRHTGAGGMWEQDGDVPGN